MNAVTAPIPFTLGERVRVTLVNDTMMTHPIHLHGHFFGLVTGKGDHAPRKHTVNVQPGGKLSFGLTADAPGDWAFPCHLLYHMHPGMMQVVTVRPAGEAALACAFSCPSRRLIRTIGDRRTPSRPTLPQWTT